MTKAARVFAKKLDVEIILKPELDETKEAVHRGLAGNPIEWGVRLFFSGHYEKQHHREFDSGLPGRTDTQGAGNTVGIGK